MAARRGCRAYPLLLDDHERLSCVVDRSLSMPHAGIERALQAIGRVLGPPVPSCLRLPTGYLSSHRCTGDQTGHVNKTVYERVCILP